MSRIKKSGGVALFVVGIALTLPGTSTAGLINGDFSGGFQGWLGEVTDLDFNITLLDPPPGAFIDNYDASTGAAVLTTTPLVNDIWSVVLFQPFVVQSPAPGESLTLAYDLGFSIPNGPSGGVALAQLTSPGSTISLLGTSSVDITSLAGQSIEILFGIEDFDGIPDQLTLDNVRVLERQVSLPGTVSLLWLGTGISLVAKRRGVPSSLD